MRAFKIYVGVPAGATSPGWTSSPAARIDRRGVPVDDRPVSVFLVRHAHAVEERRDLPDPARYLSEVGRAAARALGQRLRWHDCTPTALWTSPLTRAVMTAELVAAMLEWTGPIETIVGLSPGGSLRDVMAAVNAHDPSGTILMFGHEPGLSALGARLTGDDGFGAISKAQAVRIDGKSVRWRFAHDDHAPQAR